MYPVGTKILMQDLRFETGGGGTNTAATFRKMGLKTAYLGHIGLDENGDRIINQLKKSKIDFIGTRGKEMTNYSFILDSLNHDRTILAYKDASAHLKFSKIKKLNTKWIYSSSLLGHSFKTAEKVAAMKGIHFAFNPSNYQAKQGVKVLGKILKNTDLLVLNREEAELLLKKQDSINMLLKSLYALGPSIVIITEGKKGAYCYDGEYKFSITPKKVKIVETTGAGDAFAAGFLAAYLKKQDIAHALKIGVANAQSVIQHYGAKNLILSYQGATKVSKKRITPVKRVKI